MNSEIPEGIQSLYAECLASYGEHLVHCSDGRTTEWNGVCLNKPQFASEWRNMVVPLRPLQANEAPALAAALVDFYGSPTGWVIWSPFRLDLKMGGFTYRYDIPLMYRAAKPVDMPEIPGLRIEAVTNAEGVATFENLRDLARQTTRASFDEPATTWNARMLDGSYRPWIGYMNDEPVATTAVFETDILNMVKNVSVVPAFRNRGIGHAMSAHAVRESSKPSALDADPGAANMYLRLGFTKVGCVEFWAMDD